jgi:predicted phage tail component-like protein
MGLEVLDIRRDLFPTIRHKTVEIPGREGSILFPAPFGMRHIGVDCALIGTSGSELLDTERSLTGWLVTDSMCELSFGDSPEYYFLARVSDVCPVSQNGRVAMISIEFECEPFALSTTETTESLTLSSGQTSQLSVSGTTYALPQLRIAPVNEAIIGLELTVGSKTFKYNGTLEAGKELFRDSQKALVVKTDPGATTGDNVLGLVSGTFPTLIPATTSVKHLASNGASAKYTFVYHARWI